MGTGHGDSVVRDHPIKQIIGFDQPIARSSDHQVPRAIDARLL
jgi:hypothetical protein